jgi:hypothetical protein
LARFIREILTALRYGQAANWKKFCDIQRDMAESTCRGTVLFELSANLEAAEPMHCHTIVTSTPLCCNTTDTNVFMCTQEPLLTYEAKQ